MICFSLCESLCNRQWGPCCTVFHPHRDEGAAFSPHRPAKGMVFTSAGAWLTSCVLVLEEGSQSRGDVSIQLHKKHSTEGAGQPFVPVFWRNSHARTPCSLTTCCSQRQIVSLGRGAQTGGPWSYSSSTGSRCAVGVFLILSAPWFCSQKIG